MSYIFSIVMLILYIITKDTALIIASALYLIAAKLWLIWLELCRKDKNKKE